MSGARPWLAVPRQREVQSLQAQVVPALANNLTPNSNLYFGLPRAAYHGHQAFSNPQVNARSPAFSYDQALSTPFNVRPPTGQFYGQAVSSSNDRSPPFVVDQATSPPVEYNTHPTYNFLHGSRPSPCPYAHSPHSYRSRYVPSVQPQFRPQLDLQPLPLPDTPIELPDIEQLFRQFPSEDIDIDSPVDGNPILWDEAGLAAGQGELFWGFEEEGFAIPDLNFPVEDEVLADSRPNNIGGSNGGGGGVFPSPLDFVMPSATVGGARKRNRAAAAIDEPAGPSRQKRRRSPSTASVTSRPTAKVRKSTRRTPVILDADDPFSIEDDDDKKVEVVDMTADDNIPEELQALPDRTSTKLSKYECIICMDTASTLTVTHCGHMYCGACLYQAMHTEVTKKVCPMCRQKLEDRPANGAPPKGNNAKTFFHLEIKLALTKSQGKRPARMGARNG